MDGFVKENLEEYLSGQLGGEQLKDFERRLENDPEAVAELSAMVENASLFETLRIAEDDFLAPSPGFYARIRRQIEHEEDTSFWAVFLEPFILRRVAVAAFAWLFLMGVATFYRDGVNMQQTHMAESILAQPPAVSDYYVRLGSDLDMNRDTMLSAVLVSRR